MPMSILSDYTKIVVKVKHFKSYRKQNKIVYNLIVTVLFLTGCL